MSWGLQSPITCSSRLPSSLLLWLQLLLLHLPELSHDGVGSIGSSHRGLLLELLQNALFLLLQ